MKTTKPLSMQDKHAKRVLLMYFFFIITVTAMSILLYFVNKDSSELFWMMLVMFLYISWLTNVRFGFIENLIEGEKRHNLCKIWFEKVPDNNPEEVKP